MDKLFQPTTEFKSLLDSNAHILPFYFSHSALSTFQNKPIIAAGIAQHCACNLAQDIIRYSYEIEDFSFSEYDPRWTMAFTEAIQNSYDHGPALEKGLSLAFLVGDKAFGLGITDGGDFFKDENIAELVRERELPSRTKYPSKYQIDPSKQNKIIGREGFKRMYTYSNFLEVDISNGVLYMGFSKNIIVTKR